MHDFTLKSAGRWLVNKLLRSQRTHGTRHAAARARKMGIPVSLALLILVGRV